MSAAQPQKGAPLLLKGGKVVDGTGNPWFYGDLLIQRGQITAIGKHLEAPPGSTTLDVSGFVVTPGFIDIHSHSDLPLFIDGSAQSVVRQGVTTQVVGNCGGWSVPLQGETRRRAENEAKRYGWADPLPWTTIDEYMDVLSSRGISINVGILIGHGAVRAKVAGFAARNLTPEELSECKREVAYAMEKGALGMSTGLYYAPGSYAPEDEIVELSKVVARYDGIHSSHIRDESDYNVGLIAAIDEVIDIGRKSGVKTEISHLKCLGPAVWGRSREILTKIEKAREEGIDVTADQYPYVASGSSITGALIPRWAQEGTREDLVARLRDPVTRMKIRAEVEKNLRRRGGPDRLYIASYSAEPRYAGLHLGQVARELGLEPEEAALYLLEKQDASFVSFVMDENDVKTIMQAPFIMVASDGWALSKEGPLGEGHPHPRSFGTFVRVISKYALSEKLITLEEAVRKMTSFPAGRLGIKDRGLLKPGFKADVVVFDPLTIKDTATFEAPKMYPSGIKYVLVNGVITVKDGEHTGEKAGTVLKKT
ncbi:MAG: D-aminoacylase [Candidatus Fermentithermobacillus carboniphilus]|uniref:D-aminoacylase n=1 Tax=Candidatus Fermentithermobacillus carboniphilus TaxID=3085328 RepID=A0AAT9LD43_9FIRM|nr:MAG: D-aminoacylase [Candidatus Fermentithermobacillus carboniphilus]